MSVGNGTVKQRVGRPAVAAAFWGCCLSLVANCAAAGDWPGILGPQRNGVASAEETIADALPGDGPREVWRRAVGQGYAGVSVVGNRVFLFHREGDQEVVERLDAATGTTIWKQGFTTGYSSGIAPDAGPRCVPVCDGDAVFVLGAEGRLACLAQMDGELRWQRQVIDEFDAPEGYFGCGSTPIVVGDHLLTNVGADGAGIVAFDKRTGRTVWQATDARASYSSPVVATINGQDAVIFLTRLELIAMNPLTGDVLFKTPFGARGPTVNAANPVVADEALLVTASYGIGCVKYQLSPPNAKEIWRLDEGFSAQYTTPILANGALFGIDGRQDLGKSHLRAIDWKTGETLWSELDFGYATLLMADGKLIILSTDGELVLARASSKAYHELGRAKVLDTTTRALPALQDGHLFVRDESTLKCIDLTPQQP